MGKRYRFHHDHFRESAQTTSLPFLMLIDNKIALIQSVADVLGVTPEAIAGKRKRFAEALARQIVMTLWSEAHSLQDSAEIVNRTHHTAAFYARKKTYERLHYCEKSKERMRKILEKYSQITLEQGQNNY
jgi:chromosomal replication initiation ATPase DnaA